MTQNTFEARKVDLQKLLQDKITERKAENSNERDYEVALSILNEITYEERDNYRGKISRVIIDSLELDNTIGEALIEFDENM